VKQGKLFTSVWFMGFSFTRLHIKFSSYYFVSTIEVGFELKELKSQISNLLENTVLK